MLMLVPCLERFLTIFFPCGCKHCELLANFTESECLCCTQLREKEQALQFEECITEHPDFPILCLSMSVPYVNITISLTKLVRMDVQDEGNAATIEVHLQEKK